MLTALCAALVWAPLNFSTNSSGHVRFVTWSTHAPIRVGVSANLTRALLPRFWEARGPFAHIQADDLLDAVREVVDMYAAFVPQLGLASAAGEIQVGAQPLGTDAVALAQTFWADHIARVEVTFDTTNCFLLDAGFCERAHVPIFWAVLLGMALSVAPLACVCAHARARVWPPSALQTVAVVAALLPSALYADVYAPCSSCYSFATVFAHEMGHALGLTHPDESPNVDVGTACVNGTRARRASGVWSPPLTECAAGPCPVMWSVAAQRDACLTEDDMRGLRALYEPPRGDTDRACEAPRCAARWRMLGAYRVAADVAAVLALACAAPVVFGAVRAASRASKRVRIAPDFCDDFAS